MIDVSQSYAVYPPDGSTGGTVSVTSSSSSATALSITNGQPQYVSFISSTDCHIKFGGSTVSAAATDYLLKAGVEKTFLIPGTRYNAITHFAVIRDTADGTIYWYQSSK